MKKFLLVDDHVVVRSGIKTLLSTMYPYSTVDEAGGGDTAIDFVKKSTYDVIFLDVQMPDTDPLGLMQFFHVKYPDLKVLIFSMSAEKIYARRFLNAGARGFISKNAPMEEIKNAVELILNDRMYISPTLAHTLAEETFSGASNNPFNKLSTREFEIASLLLSGQTISEMSKALNLQVSTVGTHKARIFEKLAVKNILELKELSRNYDINT